MHAEEIQVVEMFVASRQLKIPLWQRHYSWGETHWAALWTDLLRVANGEENVHFIGSIVLQKIPWSALPSEAHQFWVVDGQQRVTTLTVLICALRDKIAASKNDPEEQEQVRKDYNSQLLVNESLKVDHRPRLVLQERDRASLDALVEGTSAGASTTAVEKAYSFFMKQLEGESVESLERLMSMTISKLTAVWVVLDNEDNGHRVFQTLNSGGKKLEQADLIRNYFFLLLGSSGNDFYEAHWREMEDALPGKELESYFIAWTISQGYQGSTASLFMYFQKDLLESENSAEKVTEYGIRLIETAQLYQWIKTPQNSGYEPRVTRALSDLESWGTRPADGLILFLLRAEKYGNIDQMELARGLEILLSFMARRLLAGYEPNVHKSVFQRVTRQLKLGQHSRAQMIDHLRYLLSEGDDRRVWPSNEEIEVEARSVNAYSPSRRHWAFLILERVERGLYENPKHAQEKLDRGKYSIEHILPQSLTEDWHRDLERWGETDPYKLHETHLHVLGNLTLTPINSELGNRSFAAKQKQLSDDSFRLNQHISIQESWTRDDIEERSVALALTACAQFVPPLRGEDLVLAREQFTLRGEAEDYSDVDEEELDDDELVGE